MDSPLGSIAGSGGAGLLLQRRFWMADKHCKACTGCGSPFTLLRRRHHCRFCGKIFCAACSSLGRHFGSESAVRVCGDCRRIDATQSGGGAAAATEVKAPVAAASAALGAADGGEDRAAASSTARRGAADAGGGARGGVDAAGVQAEGGGGGARSGGGNGVARAGLDWELRAGAGGGLGLFDDRSRLLPPSGAPFNLPASAPAAALLRGLAAAAEQHLVDAVLACCIAYISEGGAPPPGPVGPRAVQPEEPPPGARAARPEEPPPGAPAALGRNRSAWAAAILRLTRRAVALVEPNIRRGDRSDVRCYVQVRGEGRGGLGGGRPAISGLVHEPCAIEGGRQTRERASLIPPARAPLSQVKAIPSLPSDPAGPDGDLTLGPCSVIDGGVVFRQCLPHKAMREDVASPKVLLLEDALTFEGGGPPGGRLLSLDTLLEQERRYTDIQVSKVLALEPDVLFTSQVREARAAL